jgi:Zn2+/Cd2+-exporting ATPase
MSSSFALITRLPKLLKEHPDAIATGICGLLVLCGWLTLRGEWIGLSLFILSAAYVIGGYESAREGLTTLFQENELDVDLLMIVAALGAAGLGLWRREYYLIIDGAVLILIFAFSGALEGYAIRRTEHSIRSLMNLTADTVRILVHGQEQQVAISNLQLGDQVIVKPGELVPTDGIILEGFSTLNQAPITGESMPIEKTVGDQVFAGTINGNGALKLKLHQPSESSLIQRVIRLVQQAQNETPPSQQFIEQFERGYARIIVFAGILLAVLPPLVLGWDWEMAIYRALIFLVVASPCALMAAIMPTLLSGIASGARQGILFKSGAQLEAIGQVRAIAFDKTGTLTTGKLQIVDILATSPHSPDQVLQVAVALESLSEHPIGTAIVQHAQQQHLTWRNARQVQAHTGYGISGQIEQQTALVGKAAFIQPQVPDCPADLIVESRQWEQAGNSVIWVAWAGQILGMIAVADTVRPEAAQAIAHLKRLGIEHIAMLTGDNHRTADSIAQALGIDHVYAELLPEDKVKLIQNLRQTYRTVAMVGDGINDAPALAQASVGIAMGIAGSDVALETADIILMADRLEKLEHAIRLGRRAQRVVKQNIVFALSFIALLLLANFAGQITMPLGVIGHEGSTVLVTLSGLRLLRS